MTFHFSRRLYLNSYRIQRVMSRKKFQNFSYRPGCQIIDLKWWLQIKNIQGCYPAFVSIRCITRIHTILDMRFFHTNLRYAVLCMTMTAFHLIPWRNSADYLCNVRPFSLRDSSSKIWTQRTMVHRPYIQFHCLRDQQLATCNIFHSFIISKLTTTTITINFVFLSSSDFICDVHYGLKFHTGL
jgi:hypothetical protein